MKNRQSARWQRTRASRRGNRKTAPSARPTPLLADILTGVGFALLLGAGLTLRGGEVGWRQGLLWGLAGFATFTIAPSLGLPPQLPGSEAAPLFDRQLWWLGTAVATGGALALIAFTTRARWTILGAVLIVLPHLYGAPEPPDQIAAVACRSYPPLHRRRHGSELLVLADPRGIDGLFPRTPATADRSGGTRRRMISRFAVGAAVSLLLADVAAARAQELPSGGGPMPELRRGANGQIEVVPTNPATRAPPGRASTAPAAPPLTRIGAPPAVRVTAPATIAGRTATAGDRGKAEHPKGAGHRARRDRRRALFS